MSKHYVAMAGLHGCLPNYVAYHDQRWIAVGDLADMHGMSSVQRVELETYGIVELHLQEQGNAYAEVMECECEHPEQHSDGEEGCGS